MTEEEQYLQYEEHENQMNAAASYLLSHESFDNVITRIVDINRRNVQISNGIDEPF